MASSRRWQTSTSGGRWAKELEFKNYTHICYIENGLGDSKKLKARALENCRAFRKESLEICGTFDCFEALVGGRGQAPASFVHLPPGQHLTAEMFYGI